MVEPFFMSPADIARLTDFQIMGILMRQSDNVKAMQRQQRGHTADPPPKPTEKENVRCGAAYDYLISNGMTPDEAESILRGVR